MPVRTTGQVLMTQAIEHVRTAKGLTKEARKIYGGLCHKLPVLIRTCGLCQAIAFMESKTTSSDDNRKAAHEMIVNHVAEVLKNNGFENEGAQPSDAIARLPMREYTRATRVLLDACVYYKRFAESMLGVTAADEGGGSQ